MHRALPLLAANAQPTLSVETELYVGKLLLVTIKPILCVCTQDTIEKTLALAGTMRAQDVANLALKILKLEELYLRTSTRSIYWKMTNKPYPNAR